LSKTSTATAAACPWAWPPKKSRQFTDNKIDNDPKTSKVKSLAVGYFRLAGQFIRRLDWRRSCDSLHFFRRSVVDIVALTVHGFLGILSLILAKKLREIK
jgi:hypothetical protein